MERLTEWNGEQTRHAYYPRCFEEPCNGGGCKIEACPFEAEACDRLAAYEDSGLTPKEIKAPFTEDAMINLAAQALGVEPSRLRVLAEADKAGRCVVLPCRVGDKIYYLNGKYIIEVEVVGYKVDETGAWLFVGETYNPETNRAYHCDLETEQIGKTVFFTREDAEKTMEGMGNGNKTSL